MRVALGEPEDAVGIEAGVHAREDGDPLRGRKRQTASVELVGVALGVLEQLVGHAHLGLPYVCVPLRQGTLYEMK
jgi:hypothetical protein